MPSDKQGTRSKGQTTDSLALQRVIKDPATPSGEESMNATQQLRSNTSRHEPSPDCGEVGPE